MADNNAPVPDDVSRIILLTFGQMEQGGAYWCYVAVKPSRYDECKKALSGKQYNIQNFTSDGFGEVIVSGDGGLPPRDVTKKVALMFNLPMRQLFDTIDPQEAIARGIEELKKNAGN